MATMRLYVAAALGVLALSATSARAATTHLRVSIPEFQLDGSPPPALGIQLQDGFVLGWVRAGANVLDPADTAKKLEGHPELQRCDASPCMKAIGQLLDVGYIVRVKVDVAGNSYKSVGRLFSTEGAAPGALPIATESKTCDVCTVAEARAVMLRLADALRAHIEDREPPTVPAPVAPPFPAGSRDRSRARRDGGRARHRRGLRGAGDERELHRHGLRRKPQPQRRGRRADRRGRGVRHRWDVCDDRAQPRRRPGDRRGPRAALVTPGGGRCR
jgi:hypothetical protein